MTEKQIAEIEICKLDTAKKYYRHLKDAGVLSRLTQNTNFKPSPIGDIKEPAQGVIITMSLLLDGSPRLLCLPKTGDTIDAQTYPEHQKEYPVDIPGIEHPDHLIVANYLMTGEGARPEPIFKTPEEASYYTWVVHPAIIGYYASK